MPLRAAWWSPLLRGRIGLVVLRSKEIMLLDRIYQLAAASFVAFIPLTVVVATMVDNGGNSVAEQMVRRFDLRGNAADTVRDLLNHEEHGIYWLGLVIVAWSAFSLGRRLSATYTTIWGVARLRVRQQWRAAVWVLIGIVNIISVGFLREIANGRARSVLVVTVVIGLALWFGAELLSQYLLTGGQVVVRRLLVAALLVTLGKIGMTAWAEFYMPRMLGLQANMYGPLGVVFVMFTFLAVSMAVLLVATLIAAVWTAPKSELPTEHEVREEFRAS